MLAQRPGTFSRRLEDIRTGFSAGVLRWTPDTPDETRFGVIVVALRGLHTLTDDLKECASPLFPMDDHADLWLSLVNADWERPIHLSRLLHETPEALTLRVGTLIASLEPACRTVDGH